MFITHLGIFKKYTRFMQKQNIHQLWDIHFIFLYLFFFTNFSSTHALYLVILWRQKHFLALQQQFKRSKFSVLRSPFIYKSSWEQFFFNYYLLKVKKTFISQTIYGFLPSLFHFKPFFDSVPLSKHSVSFSCKFIVAKQD